MFGGVSLCPIKGLPPRTTALLANTRLVMDIGSGSISNVIREAFYTVD